MSAFVVEDKIINRVVACLASYRQFGAYAFHDVVLRETGCNLESRDGRQKLAESMFALNVQGVNARYGEGQAEEFRPLNFQYRSELPPTLIQAYKSLGCWRYQCAEGDIPESSLLYAAMSRVYDDMAHELVRGMPAYDKAAW